MKEYFAGIEEIKYEGKGSKNPLAFKYYDKDRVILIYVYGAYDTLPDNVYEKAKEFKINQNIIWDMMKEFERKVAKKRGLI
jgi:hypothetical protein